MVAKRSCITCNFMVPLKDHGNLCIRKAPDWEPASYIGISYPPKLLNLYLVCGEHRTEAEFEAERELVFWQVAAAKKACEPNE